jgi:hypothetical protein
MKIDLNILKQLQSTFGVGTVDTSKADKIISSGMSEKAPSEFDSLLSVAGYNWDIQSNSYVNGDQSVYYYSAPDLFLWVWKNVFVRGLKGTEQMTKWFMGDQKYPGGKVKHFIHTYNKLAGNVEKPTQVPNRGEGGGDIEFSGTGGRPGDYEPKPLPSVDLDIIKLKKKYPMGRLPADDIIDLYKKSKEIAKEDPEGSKKLMAFVKTLNPMEECIVRKAALEELLKEIVKGILKESNQWNYHDSPEFAATKAWGRGLRLVTQKSSKEGTVYQFNSGHKTPSRFLWKRPDGAWLSLEPKTKKWNPVPEDGNPSEGLEPLGGMEEETTTGAVSPISTPFAFKKKKAMEQSVSAGAGAFATPKAFKRTEEEQLDEMTGTDAVAGYNIPSAFSKKGGSERGIRGSETLGYTLTPIGKKDMSRHADKLYETKDGTVICRFCKKPLHYAGQADCHHCGKAQGEVRSGEASHARRFSTKK